MRHSPGEAHAEVVLGVLKKVDDLAYTAFLERKPVESLEWYQAVPKSDRHVPSQEERGEEVDEDGEAGKGCESALSGLPDMD